MDRHQAFGCITVAALVAVSAVSGMNYSVYGVLPAATRAAFGVTNAGIDLTVNAIPIGWALGFVPSLFIAGRLGPRAALVASIIMMLASATVIAGGIGAGRRLMAGAPGAPSSALGVAFAHTYGSDFVPVLGISQLCGGIGESLFLGLPAAIADLWFPPQRRATATAIGSLSNGFGVAIGAVLMPLAIGRLPVDSGDRAGCVTQAEEHTLRSRFLWVFIGQAVVLLLSLLAAVACPAHPRDLCPDAPPDSISGGVGRPRSSSAATTRRSSPRASARSRGSAHSRAGEPVSPMTLADLRATVWLLLRQRRFVALCGAVALMVLFWGWTTMLSQVLTPFGVAETTAGRLGGVFMASGALSQPLVGRWFDRYGRGRYWQTLMVIASAAVACFAALGGLMLGADTLGPAGLTTALYAVSFCGGCAYLATLGLQQEYTVELAYPVPPAVATGLMLTVSRVVVAVVGFGLARVATNHPTRQTALHWWGAVLGAMGLSLCLWGASRGPCRRYEAVALEQQRLLATVDTSLDYAALAEETPDDEGPDILFVQ